MKTSCLRKMYNYISYVRHNLANLFRVLGLSAEDYLNFDTSLKMLLHSIDDEILRRESDLYFDKVEVMKQEVFIDGDDFL